MSARVSCNPTAVFQLRAQSRRPQALNPKPKTLNSELLVPIAIRQQHGIPSFVGGYLPHLDLHLLALWWRSCEIWLNPSMAAKQLFRSYGLGC